MPVDVLQHHDAVVNDAAHGDGQAGQAHEVHVPVEDGHDQHGHHHAQGNRQGDDHGGPDGIDYAGEQGRPDLQQEHEHGDDGEGEALHALGYDLAEFLFQPGSLAVHHGDVQVGRQFAFQLQQQVVDGVGDVDGVAVGGFEHVEAHAGLPVGAGDGAGLRRGDAHVGHVNHADGRGGGIGGGAAVRAGRPVGTGESHGQVADGIQVGVPVEGADGDDAVLGRHAAGGDVHRVALQGSDDVLDGEAVGFQQRRVNGDEDLLGNAALDVHLEHAGNGLQRRRDLALDDAEQLRHVALARYAQLHDGPLVGTEREHAGVAGGVGQAQGGHAAVDLGLGGLQVGVGFKAGAHRGAAAPGGGGHLFQILHPDDHVLDGLGNLLGNLVGRALLERGRDVDDPKTDFREELLLQLLVGIHAAHQDENQRHHGYGAIAERQSGQDDHIVLPLDASGPLNGVAYSLLRYFPAPVKNTTPRDVLGRRIHAPCYAANVKIWQRTETVNPQLSPNKITAPFPGRRLRLSSRTFPDGYGCGIVNTVVPSVSWR